MSFMLTEEQEDIRKLAENFAHQEVAGLAEKIDKENYFPVELVKKMTDIGFMGINIPVEYGGAGLDEVSKALVIMEIAKCCASTAEILSVHTLSSDIILHHGTEEQKKKYLPKAASGCIGAFALTEPGAGSDASAAKTKAIADGDDYVINGSKCFISNMGQNEGDYVILCALTQPELGPKGMSTILVDRNTPGFSVGKTEDKMGLCGAAVSELIFQDCRVPKTNRIGKEGQGLRIALGGLDGGRIGMAAQAVGLAEGAIELAKEYSKQRVQFGKPICANQGIQWYFADMATNTHASRLMTLYAAELRQNGQSVTKEAAMAKYFASENAVAVTNKGLQIHGGYGYMREYPIERMYRDARIIPLYEGTSEIQKMVISKTVLK